MHATRAAVEEGIVPGGGVALVRAAKALDKIKEDGDVRTGIRLIQRAMQEPLRRIAENAGMDGAVVIGKIEDSKGAVGYNAATGVFEDLTKAGIIDPTKVVRTALQNASSIASLLLTTEALVSEIPEEKKEAAGGGMPGGGGMGGMY